MDTTYWHRGYGVMLFKDALSGSDLLWYFVKYETNALYKEGIEELKRRGYKVLAIVCDGRRGLAQMFANEKVQLCQFHQQQIVRRYLTKRPKTQASVELKKIVDMLFTGDKESFTGLFSQWEERWRGFLNERSFDKNTHKSYYTHRRLRSAYLSVKRNLPYLFTWYDCDDLHIPNTTNAIDGHFSLLKRALRAHNGMSLKHRETFVVRFFEASKRHPKE